MTDRLGICVAALMPDPLVPTKDTVRAAYRAAAAAGFTEASVWGWQLGMLADEPTPEASRAALDRLGIHVTVMEAATQWAAGGSDAAQAEAAELATLVRATGASLVLAVCLEPTLADPDVARRRLGQLADVVGRAGARVCLEFLPWSAVPDLRSAWALVEPLGPDVGIVLDTWHWQRQPGGGDVALLASIPPERFPFVQISDAAAEPTGDLMDETMHRRLLPGDGVVDFGILARLADMGARPFVALEPFNPSLLADRGVDAAAVAMRAAGLRVLA